MFGKIRSIRKRWFVAAAAVALLAVGLTFGSALAAGVGGGKGPGHGYGYGYGGYDAERRGGDGDANAKSAILARVAEIVGVTPEALEAAFRTAHNEAQTAGFTERVNGLVADGSLTQEQADAATEWFAARPEAAGPVAYYIARRADSGRVAGKLERMVAAGYLTQEQSDAIVAWQAQRPEGLPELGGDHGGHSDGDREHRRGH